MDAPNAWLAYRLRWKRRRMLFRIWRKRRQITPIVNRTDLISPDAILGFACVRNEMLRLPMFLEHYRNLGVGHFLIVDNASTDGTTQYLSDQPDVSLWQSEHSYKLSRFGMDWLGWLQWQYGHAHWCLTVDADELLVYPHHDTQDLHSLTDWLDRQNQPMMGALMLDLYPKGVPEQQAFEAGDDPLSVLHWFDGTGYRHKTHQVFGNQWIQGGARDRMFFADEPLRAPTLNKTPLVKWHWRYVYITSTHHMLPKRLNGAFDWPQRQRLTGALLHTKFLPDSAARSAEEKERKQHLENSALYKEYYEQLIAGVDMWTDTSVDYKDWRQLVDLSLISSGAWQPELQEDA